MTAHDPDKTSKAQSATPEERIRILLIDDHPSMRFGVRTLISQARPHSEIFEAGNAKDALAMIAAQEFDLVFLDARIPDKELEADSAEVGKRTLQAIREADGPPVVIMSAEDRNRTLVEEMMNLGAASFVPKSAAVEVMLEAVRRALCGGVWLPPELVGKGGTTPPPSSNAMLDPLPKPISHQELGITPREFDVLRLALNGLTPRKIALELNINHDNVRHKMMRLYEKFGTANQVSLHAHFAKTGQTLGILTSKQRSTVADAAK